MDIVTHGMMGVIVASAFAETQPMAASAFALGAVLPDLDALSRCFGKRAFLRVHQTYSHAFASAVLAGVLGWGCIRAFGWVAPWAPAALMLGMMFHSVLDYTNTYGITLFLPFSRSRFCAEWVFFIDAGAIAASALALALIGIRFQKTGHFGHGVPLGYFGAMIAYWIGRVALRRRAMGLAPLGTLSLVPSALLPWRFFGCVRDGEEIHVFRVDALAGATSDGERVPIFDRAFARALAGVPEFRSMRELSPAYHVVKSEKGPEGEILTCRDLRTRNFGTRFGELVLGLDARGAVVSVSLNV
jgi:membrane-bound metal-dependent hydrolase YbcI (DUF457 family)